MLQLLHWHDWCVQGVLAYGSESLTEDVLTDNWLLVCEAANLHN